MSERDTDAQVSRETPEEESEMTTAEFIKAVGFHALGWGQTAEATYDIARLTLERGIPGDFVECGVYAGASSALMARAIVDYWESQAGMKWGAIDALWSGPRVHLFDSFEGMPAAEPVDEECYQVHGEKTGMAKVPLDQVKGLLKSFELPEELFVFHAGWFDVTIPDAISYTAVSGLENIAVLRLDGDLYKSTKVPMRQLYPLVSIGGWVIVDDFHLTGCKKAIQETAPRIFAGDSIVNPGPVYWRKTP